ncbi:unnamed protein product [Ectocarpus sp. CCAP 1310/34]|nr:unnamed protein product [Ectocarpus sp. CCAP 1310/34]
MRETAKQQDVRLVGEMEPCAGYVEAKGRRAPVPRRGTRAAVPFGKVHIDLTGPFSDALDGSRYLIMFVDSASRWQRGYGMRAKSDTLKFVQRFLADMNGMGTPGCFRMDNGGEFTGSAFTSFCDAAGIRREHTAPDTPKQNAVVESAIWRAMKGVTPRAATSSPWATSTSPPSPTSASTDIACGSRRRCGHPPASTAPRRRPTWAGCRRSRRPSAGGRTSPSSLLEGMMRVKRATKADV